jgi:hypothetical protein
MAEINAIESELPEFYKTRNGKIYFTKDKEDIEGIIGKFKASKNFNISEDKLKTSYKNPDTDKFVPVYIPKGRALVSKRIFLKNKVFVEINKIPNKEGNYSLYTYEDGTIFNNEALNIVEEVLFEYEYNNNKVTKQ